MSTDSCLQSLQCHVEDYLRAYDSLGYNRFLDFDWQALPDSLARSGITELHLAAVETAMVVEDHIPGYASEYQRLFHVEGSRTDEEAWMRRQTLHFVFRWVAEEDRHAHVLELYLRHSGRRDAAALTALMIREGQKSYRAPHEIPSQLFAYTALQEKATQLYYSCLRQAVDEPVLRQVLLRLSQDEARHCGFFSHLVLDALHDGDLGTIALLKEALHSFRMPLSDMIENYKRKAIQMMRAAGGYDYREAFDYFRRLVKRVAEARTSARGSGLIELMTLAQALAPQR
ncbi:MAG: acyl-ACP desaturase [Armatimonadetes bacterium]|nr:acyl-ACP desaturase [Armatimonadota bacterium]